ncbi:hypothetical protein LINPERPRIM_LOCUS37543 [Linum perenne]
MVRSRRHRRSRPSPEEGSGRRRSGAKESKNEGKKYGPLRPGHL